MEQMILNFYPITAGFKAKSGPSREAAQGVTAGAARRIDTFAKICISLKHDGPATADELAERLKMDRLYVRPRVSELHTIGKVYDTGERRENVSGRKATVWGLNRKCGERRDPPRQQ